MKITCPGSCVRGFSLIELLVVIAVLGILAAISIPYYMHSKQSARSASAIASLRLIHNSQVSHRSAKGSYGDLTALGGAGYIDDPLLRAGNKSSYLFTVTLDADPAVNYEATATPTDDPTFWRHFFVNGAGIIRFKDGAAADATSPGIE